MKVRRVRCPKCKSLKTIKNGQRKLIDYSLQRKSSKSIQRYKCTGYLGLESKLKKYSNLNLSIKIPKGK